SFNHRNSRVELCYYAFCFFSDCPCRGIHRSIYDERPVVLFSQCAGQFVLQVPDRRGFHTRNVIGRLPVDEAQLCLQHVQVSTDLFDLFFEQVGSPVGSFSCMTPTSDLYYLDQLWWKTTKLHVSFL